MPLAVSAEIKEFVGTSEAVVDFGGGVLKTISIAFLEYLTVGDYVLVHSGFALSRFSPAEAKEFLEGFNDLS